jgi:hypothetical protein
MQGCLGWQIFADCYKDYDVFIFRVMLSDKTFLPSELRFLMMFDPADDSTVILQYICNYLPFVVGRSVHHHTIQIN